MLGLLTVHPGNPRYFADGTGKVTYLTGSHTWTNLQDYGPSVPLPEFDWEGYLDLMQRNHHNFMRMWAWEQARWRPSPKPESVDTRFAPLPFMRTGPGLALDGKPKFDLTQLNQDYFDRMRSRVIEAGERGIYVGIMLFQGFSVESYKDRGNPWPGHPFNRDNNINGIDGDADGNGEGEEVHTLEVPAVTRLQEAYVRKVVDTVNDLDHVLYEIGNEIRIGSKEWQYHIVVYIKGYEATKPKQHPVGMTYFYSGRKGAMEALFESPADWISPGNDGNRYFYDERPRAADGRKVILSDTDHFFGVGGDDKWVWKSFCRGLNPIYMDPIDDTGDWVRVKDFLALERARRAMGQTLDYANKVNLAAMTPHDYLASTVYCLADRGSEYLAYQPEEGPFRVNLELCSGAFSVEWFEPESGETTLGSPVTGGTTMTFNPPFGGSAVLYLKKR